MHDIKYIDSNNNSKCEENIERFMVTDNTWNYKFDNLDKWSYTIIQEPRNNWENNKTTW